jgi:2-octaprenyl-6-methoxyphenol hydroxylase
VQLIDADCVVIGAGLVGCITALGLSQNGFRVQIVERDRVIIETPEDARALVLSSASIQILKALRIWPQLAEFAYSLKEVRVSEQGAYGSVLLSAEEAGMEELGCSYPAGKMLAVLRRAVIEDQNILVRDQANFTGFNEDDERCEVSIIYDGCLSKITSQFLIGADGMDSRVRSEMGSSISTITYGQKAVVAKLTASSPCNHRAYEHFTGQGPLAFIPTGLNTYTSIQCFDVENADHALTMSDSEYLRLTEKSIGERLGSLFNLGKRYSYPLTRQKSNLLVGRRAVIVGNAANVVHPNGAQGLNLGFRDVATLLTAMKRWVKGCEPRAILELYSNSRSKDHRVTGGLTNILAQGYGSQLHTVAALRQLSMFTLSHSVFLRKRLTREASGLDFLDQNIDFSLWTR